jgi:hypothetical protein
VEHFRRGGFTQGEGFFAALALNTGIARVTQATCDIVSHEKIIFDDKNRQSMGTVLAAVSRSSTFGASQETKDLFLFGTGPRFGRVRCPYGSCPWLGLPAAVGLETARRYVAVAGQRRPSAWRRSWPCRIPTRQPRLYIRHRGH